METREALRKARTELDSLGLADWRLAIDARPTRRLGQTRYGTRTIGLSGKFVALNAWDEVRITVRHESAHALVGPGFGHGPVWKRKARELGVPTSSKLRSENLVLAPGRWTIVCPTHGAIGTRSRKDSRRYVHTGCGEIVSLESS